MGRRSRIISRIRKRSGFAEPVRAYSVPSRNALSVQRYAPVPSVETSHRRPIIFISELDCVSRCILDCPDIETGGQLFGYWTERGVPVVMYTIGPGKNANHQPTLSEKENFLCKIPKAYI